VQSGEDPFTRLENERKAKMKPSKKGVAAAGGAVPATVKLATKLDAGTTRGQIAKGKAMKGDIENASHLAGVSTASMGKFDKRLNGEKGARKLPGLRTKHLPIDGGDAEGGMVSKVLGKVIRCAACALSALRARHDPLPAAAHTCSTGASKHQCQLRSLLHNLSLQIDRHRLRTAGRARRSSSTCGARSATSRRASARRRTRASVPMATTARAARGGKRGV
jgi:hypothetical protein